VDNSEQIFCDKKGNNNCVVAVEFPVRFPVRALVGTVAIERPVPENVVQQDGRWNFSEFDSDAGVKNLGLEDPSTD